MSEITFEQIDRYAADLAHKPESKALSHAVQNVGPKAAIQAAINGSDLDPVFSVELATGDVSNQKKSGRCWLFSTLNTVRHGIASKLKVKNFEFSQNYNAFYDRLEKANLFYEQILATANLPLGDRTVAAILANPDTDGGQFDEAQALIEKYGLVPKSVMPETYNSENTAELNQVLNGKLRKDAKILRELVAQHTDAETIATTKRDFLSLVYRMLAYTFGTPPTRFDYAWRDDDHQYHLLKDQTPLSFYHDYVEWHFDDFITVASSPQNSKQYGQLYTIPAENTVVGGHPMTILNLPKARLAELALQQLQSGEAVWFGNDVIADMDRKSGALKGGLFDYGQLFDVDLTMTKAQRMDTTEAVMSHAMTLTGADVVDGQVTKWKVENSWGKDNGHNGYFVADAKWFDDYAYEVVVRKSLLTPEEQAALTQTPITLPAWDILA